jgi:hypothetical protein
VIRFILKRKHKSDPYAAGTECYETIVAEVPNLEQVMQRGGVSQNGWDITELVGIEIITAEKPT